MSCERGVSTALRRATEQCRAGRELNAQEVADLVVVHQEEVDGAAVLEVV